MKARIDVRVDDLGIDLKTAKRLAARLTCQEKRMPASHRRKWGARVDQTFAIPTDTTATAGRFIFANTSST